MEIVTRLSYPKAIVRKNLLKMLKSIIEGSRNPKMYVTEYHGIYPIVRTLAEDGNMILVKEIANQILLALTAAIGLSPPPARRTTSDLL